MGLLQSGRFGSAGPGTMPDSGTAMVAPQSAASFQLGASVFGNSADFHAQAGGIAVLVTVAALLVYTWWVR